MEQLGGEKDTLKRRTSKTGSTSERSRSKNSRFHKEIFLEKNSRAAQRIEADLFEIANPNIEKIVIEQKKISTLFMLILIFCYLTFDYFSNSIHFLF